jgi:diguanylate cyclase (GGDEF)-like protein
MFATDAPWDELTRGLEAGGHRVVSVPLKELVVRAAREKPDAILVREGDRTATVEALSRLRKAVPAGELWPTLVLQSGGELERRTTLLAVADDVLAEPAAIAEVIARTHVQLRTRRIIDELRAQRVDAESRSFADAVTGLRNRVYIGERLNEEWRRSTRYNEPLSLLLLGIDDLEGISETKGANLADRLLHDVAQLAVKSLRQIDVVTRYGPAELAALLPNTHFAGSCTCANRLRARIAKLEIDGVRPTVSMGIAFFPGKDVSGPSDLMRLAGRALERAREEGRGQICLFQHQGYLLQTTE